LGGGDREVIKPYKFTDIKRKKYLELLSEGTRRGVAAKEVGVTRQTVSAYIKENPAFADEVSLAELDATEPVEDALYQAALSGNVVAIQVWLYNRASEQWKDKRQLKTEITGKDGGAIEIESPTDRIASRIAGYASRKGPEEDSK
jgi:predicted transcriptional regulator